MDTMKTPGRNDACWCGSGKKYKKCHFGQEPPAELGGIAGLPQAPAAGAVKKGRVSPGRPVPPEIRRPEYADGTSSRPPRDRSCVKSTPDEVARMRHAGKIARAVLDATLAAVRPGISTDELDAIAHARCIELGGYPSPLGYYGYPRYPKSICTSVNEVICHGIPDDRVLVEGDIINCDITVYIDGMHGDCSETVFVGRPDPQSKKLVQTTYECMMAGIGAVAVGARLNEIGKAITALAHKRGFSVVRDFAGHGIGERFHMDPQIVHYRDPKQVSRIKSGMTFTVEPMINVGTPNCVIWDDGWTAVTSDGKRSAQFEHTLLVTEAGVELLTGGEGPPMFQRQIAENGW